jgi:hypothetical protein
MARDPEKYVYVEVALPKASTSTQRIVAESEESGVALRVLVKQAVHAAYRDDSPVTGQHQAKTPRRTVKRVSKTKVQQDESTAKVSDVSVDTADAFLDDDGF